MRPCRLVSACLLAVAFSPASTSAQEAEPYLFEYSTVPMVRHASLLDGAVRLGDRGTDWLVDEVSGDLLTRKSRSGFLARAGKWAAFDFFLGYYAQAQAHERGHEARGEELGLSVDVDVGSPWSASGFFSVVRGALSRDPRDGLSLFGGGLEGAAVLADRVEDRIHARGIATVADLTMLLVIAGKSEQYILKDLSEGRLSTPGRFFTEGPGGLAGDPAMYATNLTAARLSLPAFARGEATPYFAEIQSTARSIRRDSLINLADYGLVTTAVGLFHDYMWTGERRLRVRWLKLGPIEMVPSLRYFLSPIGPERQVRARYRRGVGTGQAYVRWTDALPSAPRGLVGAGGEYQHGRPHGFEPKLGVDIWRNPDRTQGARGELGTTWNRSSPNRLILSAAAGAKTRGYLLGYPMDRGFYVNVGAGIRF